jgi:hypothetical protein
MFFARDESTYKYGSGLLTILFDIDSRESHNYSLNLFQSALQAVMTGNTR